MGVAGGMLNWMMNTGFDIVLLLLAVAAGAGLIAWIVMQTRNGVGGITQARSLVESTGDDTASPREAFAANIQALDEALTAHRTVGKGWRRFAPTIQPAEVTDGEASEVTLISRATAPTAYFTPAALALEDPKVAIAPAAFLAVFTTIAGIGLAASIGGIAAAVAPAAADTGSDGMRLAIASAGGKLVVLAVAVGLFLALRATVAWSRRANDDAVNGFNEALLDRVYFQSADSVGVRQQDAAQFQAKSLQRLGDKLAKSIGGSTRDAILDGYSEIVSRMEVLTGRYDDLVANAQAGARDAVAQAFNESVASSSDTVVNRMEAVTAHLSTLPQRMEEAARAFEAAGAGIASEQQRFASDLQATANETVSATTGAVVQNVEQMIRGILEESRDVTTAVSDRLARLPDRVEEAARTFDNALSQMITVQATIADDTQSRTQHAVDQVTSLISKSVNNMAAAVDETISVSLLQTTQALQSVSTEMVQLPERLSVVAGTLEQTGSNIAKTHMQVLEELKASTREMTNSTANTIAERVNENTASFIQKLNESNDMFEARTQSLAAVLASFEQSGNYIAETHTAFMTKLQQSAREMTIATADTIVERVNENATSLIGKLNESNDLFEARARSMAAVLASFEQTGERISETHTQFMAQLQQNAREMTAATADEIAARVNENATGFIARLQETNEAFDTRTQSLAALLTSIEQTGDRMAQTHVDVLADFKIGAKELTRSTADAITERVNENTTGFIEKLNESNTAFEERLQSIGNLLVTLEQTGDRISESHTRFMVQVQQNTRDLTASTVESISRSINQHTTSFIDKLNESNTAFEERASALSGLFATLQKASDRIAVTHTQFMDEMQQKTRELTTSTADEIAERINRNTVSFIDKLNETNDAFEERAGALAGLFATLQKASDRIAETHTRFIGEIQSSSRDLIATTTHAVAEEIQQHTANIISSLHESDEYFASRVQALSSLLPQIDQTSKALAAIMERVAAENGRVGSEFVELTESLHAATSNIKHSADSFSNNLLEIQQSLHAFEQISRDTIEAVGTSQRTLKESIGMQAELWQHHVERFDDVDRKLGDVFAEMSAQIGTQTRYMRDQVAEMDGALASAVNHLGELIEELNETRTATPSRTGAYG